MMIFIPCVFIIISRIQFVLSRDEEKIMKACYWPNEVYEPCFGGCAEISCDNPRNHLRPCYPYCEPGCICEEPYVRDDRTHQCVLPQDCSPTQMGIPVPAKRQSSSPTKYNRPPRNYIRRDESVPQGIEFSDTDGFKDVPAPRSYDGKRPGSDVSRMGNYFNIVIAPPPIKALQPRKLLPSETARGNTKRIL